MALYAYDDEDLLFAADAAEKKVYWCLDCFLPVKVRRGKHRFPHFYHLKSSPKCRLYSKSEDHMRAQLQLEKLFPPSILQLERPFIKIDRVADLCWENEKIIFEIQCSMIAEKEAQSRIRDYRSIGYQVIWLLDDRVFNKSVLRPAEAFLRSQASYFLDLKPGLFSDYYDQFEIFFEGKRIKKGRKLWIDLQQPRRSPSEYPKDFPEQIMRRIPEQPTYFYRDRISVAMQSLKAPSLRLFLENWRALEIQFKEKPKKKPSAWKKWIYKRLIYPYRQWLERLISN